MAKRKPQTTDGNGNGGAESEKANRQKGFTGHHKDMKAAGMVSIFDARPRHQPYKVEEWMSADRRLHLLKVYDDGRIVRFSEVESTTDPTATVASMK